MYHPGSIQTKDFTTGLFGGKYSMSGKREAVNRSADNTFIKINIKMLNNDQQNTTQ